MNKPTIPVIEMTECCALRQLSANNYSTERSIRGSLGNAKRNGYRAVFVITLVSEAILVERLVKLGFKEIATFSRRRQYDKTPLTMWLIKW